MSWLLLSILSSAIVVIMFKYFEHHGVHTFHGIIVNYGVCFLIGNIFLMRQKTETDIIHAPWLYWSLVLGVLFITVFNAIGWVAQKVSVSVSMVAAKMSVVIPVLFAVFYLHEELHLIKVLGIILSLAALYFVVVQKREAVKAKGFYLFLPLLVFAGSGAIDTIMKYIQVTYLGDSSTEAVLTVVFGMAFISGLLWYFIQPRNLKTKFTLNDWLGGIALGTPNYFSMYFLFRALHQRELGATVIFPLNNIGIVLLSTLLAFVLFKERLTAKGIFGIVLAVISIVTIAGF